MTNFGAAMRTRREELKLTQEALAAKAGLSKGSISMIETGERAPSVKSVIILASALEMPVDDLFDEMQKDATLRMAEKMAVRRQAVLAGR
jgi:transcriptional regulator with XRE-family HTH domain